MMNCSFLPSIGIDVLLLLLVGGYLMVSMRMSRRVDDAGVVPAIGQNECHIGIGQHLNFVN